MCYNGVVTEVGIYVPTRGYVWHETAAALGGALPTYIRCNTGVSDAREIIVQHFLAGKCEILVMCDDDVVPPEDWLRIVEHVEEGRTDVCAAVCPIILPGTVTLPNVFERNPALERKYQLSARFIRENGLQEVDAVGTGLIAIHRRVLEDKRMQKPFSVDFGYGMGEDVRFCERAKKSRWKVAVDFDCWCDHMTLVHANGIGAAYMEIINEGLKP